MRGEEGHKVNDGGTKLEKADVRVYCWGGKGREY